MPQLSKLITERFKQPGLQVLGQYADAVDGN